MNKDNHSTPPALQASEGRPKIEKPKGAGFKENLLLFLAGFFGDIIVNLALVILCLIVGPIILGLILQVPEPEDLIGPIVLMALIWFALAFLVNLGLSVFFMIKKKWVGIGIGTSFALGLIFILIFIGYMFLIQ